MSSNIKANIPFYLSIAAIVALFFIVEINLLSKGFFALSADESGHTLEAYEWYKGDGQIFSIWLPFYKVVNGIALRVYYDLLVTPRIVSGLFGLLTLISFIFLTHQLFDNRVIAVLAGFLCTIFIPTAVFGILPLTEIYLFFFLLISIIFSLLWFKGEKNVFLWLTVILLGLATTTRYEAWIFAIVIFTIIFIKISKSDKTFSQKVYLVLPAAIIVSAFPLYWVYLSMVSNENVHGFVTAVSNRYNAGEVYSEIKNNVLYLFMNINVVSLNIIGLASLAYLININIFVKKYAIILFGTLITFSVISFAFKAMPTHNHWRVAMIWCLLLLPFTAHWLYNLLDSAKKFLINKYSFIIFFILIIYFFNSQTQQHTSLSYFTYDEISIGKFLNKITQNDQSKIYVMKDAADKWRFANILVASQKPMQFVTELDNFKFITSDIISLDIDLKTELINKAVKYVLIPSKKNVQSEFLTEIKSFDQWKIFALK